MIPFSRVPSKFDNTNGSNTALSSDEEAALTSSTASASAAATTTVAAAAAAAAKSGAADKKLETPLAAMLPSKYANIDVRELFPDFRPDKVLRFSRLFGPGKPSSLPQIWRSVRKRRGRRKMSHEGSSSRVMEMFLCASVDIIIYIYICLSLSRIARETA